MRGNCSNSNQVWKCDNTSLVGSNCSMLNAQHLSASVGLICKPMILSQSSFCTARRLTRWQHCAGNKVSSWECECCLGRPHNVWPCPATLDQTATATYIVIVIHSVLSLSHGIKLIPLKSKHSGDWNTMCEDILKIKLRIQCNVDLGTHYMFHIYQFNT